MKKIEKIKYDESKEMSQGEAFLYVNSQMTSLKVKLNETIDIVNELLETVIYGNK